MADSSKTKYKILRQYTVEEIVRSIFVLFLHLVEKQLVACESEGHSHQFADCAAYLAPMLIPTATLSDKSTTLHSGRLLWWTIAWGLIGFDGLLRRYAHGRGSDVHKIATIIGVKDSVVYKNNRCIRQNHLYWETFVYFNTSSRPFPSNILRIDSPWYELSAHIFRSLWLREVAVRWCVEEHGVWARCVCVVRHTPP